MRNLLFTVLLMLAFVYSMPASADPIMGDAVVLGLHWEDPSSGHSGVERSLVPFPEVSISSHVLYFMGSHASFTLELRDASDTVVYTAYIYATDTQVSLPTTLTGTYELRLCTDDYYFYGEITL